VAHGACSTGGLQVACKHGSMQVGLELASVWDPTRAPSPITATGGWLPWFAGSCGAALTTLCHLKHQLLGAAAAPAAPGKSVLSNGHSSGYITRSRVRVQAHACGGGETPEAAAATVGTHHTRRATPRAAAATPARDGVWLRLVAAVVVACAAVLATTTCTSSSSSPATLLALAVGAMAPACFHRLMEMLPNTLSLGECSLLTQGVLLALASAVWALQYVPAFLTLPVSQATDSALRADDLLSPFVSLLTASVLVVSCSAWAAISCSKSSRCSTWTRHLRWAAAMAGIIVAASTIALLAVWTLAVFVPERPERVWLLVYWIVVLAAALPVMRVAAVRKAAPQVGSLNGLLNFEVRALAPVQACTALPSPLPRPPLVPTSSLSALHTPNLPTPLDQIILRKGYHLVAAALFLPAFFWDLPLLCASLAIAFAALVAAEVARCAHVPVLGRAVQVFMQVGWG